MIIDEITTVVKERLLHLFETGEVHSSEDSEARNASS
jgi:hypothetical protein